MAGPGKIENLTPFDSERGAAAGRIGGANKKGSKHLSTWIQDLLNDEEFTTTIREGLQVKEWKGAPVKAIVKAHTLMAINGDVKAADLLFKYGYGQKMTLANDEDHPITGSMNPAEAAAFAEYLKGKQ